MVSTTRQFHKYQFNLPFHSGALLASGTCSRKKNSRPSNPCWPALEPPPVLHAKLGSAGSSRATWCNSGQAPTLHGNARSCWWVRCATQARFAARFSAHTAEGGKTHGTAILRLKWRGSDALCSPSQPSKCAARDTGRPVQVVIILCASPSPKRWKSTAIKRNHGDSIRYRNQTPTVPNECWLAGFSWPDNEHHAALCRSP